MSLQWRHIEHDGVSNHQRLDCLRSRLFGRKSKRTSKLRITGLCEGNSTVTGEFSTQRETNAEMVPLMTLSCHAAFPNHYGDVVMDTIASQITSLAIVYSTVSSGAYQRKHQSSASLAFVRGIHWGPVNYPHKWPVTRKMFPFDDVIMQWGLGHQSLSTSALHLVKSVYVVIFLILSVIPSTSSWWNQYTSIWRLFFFTEQAKLNSYRIECTIPNCCSCSNFPSIYSVFISKFYCVKLCNVFHGYLVQALLLWFDCLYPIFIFHVTDKFCGFFFFLLVCCCCFFCCCCFPLFHSD